jgi:hypothetical protein
VKARKAVDAWLADRTDWVEQFAALDEALPGTDRFYLTELILEPAPDPEALGRIRGTGFGKDGFVIRDLSAALREKGYDFVPQTVITSPADPQYPSKTNLDLLIPRPKPPVASAPSSPAPAAPSA